MSIKKPKYKGRYRSGSHQLKHWDYSSDGMYYITLVTQNRVCGFGKIENEKMVCSDFGAIVDKEWLRSFDMRRELFLDVYQLMPNHIHAIVGINNPKNWRADDNNPWRT